MEINISWKERLLLTLILIASIVCSIGAVIAAIRFFNALKALSF